MMKFSDVLRKTVLPLAFLAFWVWMVRLVMGVGGLSGWFWFLLLAGLPFGIHKMCVILIPRGMDVSGMVGMIALSVVIGGLIGSIMIPVYLVRAAYVLLRYVLKK